nr:hypothetical protein GCM10020092_034300 [Actinoplanes digitatis]
MRLWLGIGALRQPANRGIYAGLLCTVDLRNDPLRTFGALLSHEPPAIDFLLPHGNWEHPPPGVEVAAGAARPTPYAEWLIPVFDRWYDARPPQTMIRMFESIISLSLGGPSLTDTLGLDPAAAIVVESDGSFEGHDALKTAGGDGGATGLSVADHSIDDVVRHVAVAGARHGLAGLGPECRRCPVVRVCGGGLFAHRYAPGGRIHPRLGLQRGPAPADRARPDPDRGRPACREVRCGRMNLPELALSGDQIDELALRSAECRHPSAAPGRPSGPAPASAPRAADGTG